VNDLKKVASGRMRMLEGGLSSGPSGMHRVTREEFENADIHLLDGVNNDR
jgi:hypothetical protein